MDRRRILMAGVLVLLAPGRPGAQTQRRTPLVGFVSVQPAKSPFVEAFHRGLRDLGYVDGQNVRVEHRSSEGITDRLPALAAEMVRLQVDVIVIGGGGTGIRAAKQATTTIPIVSPASSDPVAFGHVASYARPGGNVTGLSIVEVDTSPKRVQLVRELLPGAKRVAVLRESGPLMLAAQADATAAAARSAALEVHFVNAQKPDEYEAAFDSAAKAGAQAMIVLPSASFAAHRRQLVELASRKSIVAIWENRAFTDAGGLISYGPDIQDMYRRAATYVDKILKGAKPADLPIEQATKFDLVVNLKTAKAQGIKIPPSLLVRADHVIK